MAVDSGNGGELAVRALTKLGLETLFTLPGSHIASLLDAARRAGIPIISARHEENAVLMAEGWALATGRPGFAAVTAGPGLANALPGMAEANAAGAPVVVVAGRTAISKRGRGAVQDLE
ncbi:MAG: thiamine pyrophosphate-binding protein, partial [Candidatus Dormibacteria bacterium]